MCVGSMSTLPLASRNCRNGVAAMTRNATVGMSTTIGRFMTQLARPAQKPPPLAAGELVAEPVDDEQRIVDRDAESDQRDDVERVLRYVGEAVQEERAADAADDRQDAHAQGQAGSDDRREDQDEKDEGDGKRDV